MFRILIGQDIKLNNTIVEGVIAEELIRLILLKIGSWKDGLSSSGLDRSVSALIPDINRHRQHLSYMIDNQYIERKSTEKGVMFSLTPNGWDYIFPIMQELSNMNNSIEYKLREILDETIKIKGTISGVYFSFNDALFRFHAKWLKDKLVLHMRLPNGLNETLGVRSNDIFVLPEVLEKTDFLTSVVRAHMQMLLSMRNA